MELHKTMNGVEMAGLLTAIAGTAAGVGGFFGGLKIGQSKQIEAVLRAAEVFEKSYNFTRAEADELREGLMQSKAHQEKCESDLCEVKTELFRVGEIVKKHINPNYVPKKN